MVLRNPEGGRTRVGGLLWASNRLYPLGKAACPDHPLLRETRREVLHDLLDPIMELLRYLSPTAMIPIAVIWFGIGELSKYFLIFWGTFFIVLINTMVGVRAIPQDYWNVAKVLRLSRFTTFTRIIVPATLPYMFTGYRLSLGIAWLVIVASEMLTGTPGIGGFLWQEYNSLIYPHILLAIVTIGAVGFTLDRLMGFAESRLRAV